MNLRRTSAVCNRCTSQLQRYHRGKTVSFKTLLHSMWTLPRRKEETEVCRQGHQCSSEHSVGWYVSREASLFEQKRLSVGAGRKSSDLSQAICAYEFITTERTDCGSLRVKTCLSTDQCDLGYRGRKYTQPKRREIYMALEVGNIHYYTICYE